MPRRNRSLRSNRPAPGAAARSGTSVGWSRVDSGSDGDWLVRTVPAAHATKMYRCPGCDHEIRPGTAHVVAWPADEQGGVEDRRHWHNGCWSARNRRKPTRRWS